jgi:tight adherence protein C
MTALPVLWCSLLLVAAWSRRPSGIPVVVRGSIDLGAVPAAIGAVVLRLLHRPHGDARRLGRALLAGAVALPVLPVAAPGLAMAVWGAPALSMRRARRARAEAVLRSLPEVVDLLHLAVGAGLTVPLAVEAVARRADGPIATELRVAVDEVAMGRRLADALVDVPVRAGEAVRPVVTALVASDRYGAPLAASLGRIAAEVRADRRRRAEEIARRVPVKLLFPLVCCVLPAFGLLTLAPLIAGAVAALRL